MLDVLSTSPLLFIIYIFALLLAITVHEFSHALAADYLGDPTPRLMGRVSLNPLKHLDPIGTLFLLFFRFGWGKPVQFDPFNLKNPRKDAALISLAGPISNFILAILLSIILRFSPVLTIILAPVIQLNILLGVFNFLPVSPLDGFKMVGGILSEKKAHEWYQLERYGIIFLLLLILPLGPGGSSMLSFVVFPVVSFITGLLIPS